MSYRFRRNLRVKQNNKTLKKGKDYTVSYKNNKNAGNATVIITGKGNYSGKTTRTFKITKATPKLKFSKTNVEKMVNQKQFTNKLTKKTDGTLSFTSSNKNVATVNKKTGKVTIKGVGETTITVKSKAGKNYKAGKASYTLSVYSGNKTYIALSASSVTVDVNESKTITAYHECPVAGVYYQWEYIENYNYADVQWGEWNSTYTSCPLTIWGVNKGSFKLRVKLYNSSNNKLIAKTEYITVTVK